jgi:hypothetical protein
MSRIIEVSDATYEMVESLASALRVTPGEWVTAEVERSAATGTEIIESADRPPLNGSSGDSRHRLEISDDVFARIEAAACADGVTVTEWIAARVCGACPNVDTDGTAHSTPPGNGTLPGTLADEFRGRTGFVSLPDATLSERTGELFTNGVLDKYRSGHL